MHENRPTIEIGAIEIKPTEGASNTATHTTILTLEHHALSSISD
ncbi:MAG: hypothetical protein AAF716_21890 [Cyanobacteria bacterium P01_D01_bin.1]